MKSRSLFLIAMILTVLGAGPVLAQGKKGGGSTQPLPNVRYTLQSYKHPSFPALATESTYATYLTNSLLGLNNWGECVGSYGTPDGHQHAWYFDPQTMTQALDLNGIGVDIPSGEFLSQATSINDSGEIVGSMRKIADPMFRRGFVIELRPASGTLPVLHELPEDPTWVDTYPRRINNQGEILGIFNDGLSLYSGFTAYLYNFKNPTIAPRVSDRMLAGRATHDLNNFGDVVATDSNRIGFLWDGVTTTSLYPTHGISRINDAGTLCGSLSQVVQVRKGVTATSYYLYRDFGSGPVKVAGSDGKTAVDAFNNSGTILCGGLHIFQDAWGFIEISKLLTGPIGPWTGGFGSGAIMNDAGPSGFGQIAGVAGREVGEQPTYLLLTPYVP
jgi:hypothetical protein